MGIGLHGVHLLSKAFPHLDNLSERSLLTLGVQDCAFTYDEVASLFLRHGIPYVSLNTEEIQVTTGFKGVTECDPEQYRSFIHQETLFRMFGFQQQDIHSMDVSRFEGAEIIHDLNVPVDDSLQSKFDVIFDGGTIEHVFSTKDSLFNLCRMCKVGGFVISIAPCDFINHGFVNFNTGMFLDCFEANGFKEVFLKYVSRPRVMFPKDRHYLEFDPEAFQGSLQPYYATEVFSVFRKMKEQPLRIPQQGFYRRLWEQGPVESSSTKNGFRKFLLDEARAAVDNSFYLSAVIRGYRAIKRAKKVSL
jgi:hypothetical protein